MPAEDALPPQPSRVEDPDEAQRRELRDRARAYAARELSDRGFADLVPPSSLEFAVSTNGQRTRRVADIRVVEPVDAEEPQSGETALEAPHPGDPDTPSFEITLTWAYYTSLSWAEFAVALRHELVHAVEYVDHGSFSHGPPFRRYAADFDTVVDPADLVPDVLEAIDHRYRLECLDCAFDAVRDKASRVVKRPDRRRCPDCGASLRVRHTDSGRTWTTASGYRSARAAVENAGDVAW